MSDWIQIYNSRKKTGEEAVGVIRSGDHIITAAAAGEPRYLFQKLVERKDQLWDVRIRQGINIGEAPYCEKVCEGHFIVSSFFGGVHTREALRAGRGEYVCIHYFAQPRAIREKKLPCNVVFMQCTPPNESGYVNMGLTCDLMRAAIETADRVVAQVNRKYPYICGDTLVHVSEIDMFVEYDEEPLQIPLITDDDPVSRQIGKSIASLIRDGDCLQLGQGRIPNAILKCLQDKKDLGIHTEVFSDNLMPLIASGVINGRKKNIDRRKIVATFIQVTRALYDFIHKNDMISLQPVDYTNRVGVISQNDNMVAINSALEVDLMGQIVADTVNGRPFSGVGGQLDFLRGAEESRGGRPIIALPATAKNGTVSRIVANIPAGNPITSTRHDAHYIITEYGIAELLGASLSERARRIIEIAAPQFRASLEEEYSGYVKKISG